MRSSTASQLRFSVLAAVCGLVGLPTVAASVAGGSGRLLSKLTNVFTNPF